MGDVANAGDVAPDSMYSKIATSNAAREKIFIYFPFPGRYKLSDKAIAA